MFKPAPETAPAYKIAAIKRSLESYYAAKGQELSLDSIYYRFIELERALRTFGEPIDAGHQSIPVRFRLQSKSCWQAG